MLAAMDTGSAFGGLGASREAAISMLAEPAIANSPYPEVVRYLKQRHRQRARRWAAREEDEDAHRQAEPGEQQTLPSDEQPLPKDADHEHFTVAPSHESAAIDDRRAEEYRRVRSAMLAAEQQAILDLRDSGVIGDDVMRRIQRDLDLETMLLETSEPVIDTVSEVPSAIDASF